MSDLFRNPREKYDVMWLRRTALFATLVTILLLVASPSIVHSRRKAHFEFVCALVASYGGSLSFDLQGDYWLILEGSSAEEKAIDALLPHLRSLPSGFTFIGPGEGRNFYMQLDDSNITVRGLTDLCSLPITSVMLTNCPNLGDDAVDALVTLQSPYAIIGGDVRLSPGALKRLRIRMLNAFPNVRE
ncbi:MAG: hypothetical protein MUC83_05180 [Pirellula sp.]|nr:hypothetical protein [Pirellula sp.]